MAQDRAELPPFAGSPQEHSSVLSASLQTFVNAPEIGVMVSLGQAHTVPGVQDHTGWTSVPGNFLQLKRFALRVPGENLTSHLNVHHP